MCLFQLDTKTEEEIIEVVHLSMDFCGDYFDVVKTYCAEVDPPLDPHSLGVQGAIMEAIDRYPKHRKAIKRIIDTDAI